MNHILDVRNAYVNGMQKAFWGGLYFATHGLGGLI
jgi:hypothetical protein